MNGNVTNSVNLPNLKIGQGEPGRRLCIIHEADQQTAAKIHQDMVLRGCKSKGFVSKQKDNFAYTVIDTEQEISDEILEAVNGLEAVYKARII